MRKAHLISNSKSGHGAGHSVKELAEEICKQFNHELVHYDISDPSQINSQAEKAVKAALKDQGVVIAAGGDGTVRSVAQFAKNTEVTFAAVPCGTFNFFARTHQIPEDPQQALQLALTGKARPVRLGEINGEVFLINASMGLYEKAISERESRTKRFGRNRFIVIMSTMASMLSKHRLHSVSLEIDGQNRKFLTPMIFIGNNALQLRDLEMSVAQCMKQDLLALVMMKPLGKLDILRILFRGFFRTIEKEEKLETLCVNELTIHTRKKFQSVALDGEIFKMQTPFKVLTLPKILNTVLPPESFHE